MENASFCCSCVFVSKKMTFTGRESETLSLFQNALTSFSSFSFFSSCLQVSSLLASAARTPLPAAVEQRRSEESAAAAAEAAAA